MRVDAGADGTATLGKKTLARRRSVAGAPTLAALRAAGAGDAGCPVGGGAARGCRRGFPDFRCSACTSERRSGCRGKWR